ncbi:MAG: SixA phosphatase family protein [Pyrinomonadaceae bacterium]
MKTLYLMRHAKSSWKDKELADFDRPLNRRGKAAAELMGTVIQQRRLRVDLVLSSPAVRARQTTEIVMRSAKLRPEVRLDQRIYEAGPLQLLEVISDIENSVNNALLVGHNPGLTELLGILTTRSEYMATATLARINLETTKWSKINPCVGTLAWLVKPKDLSRE